jgi:hypothetical protein
MFTPHGDEYRVNLAGCVLICGDTIYGNPADSTPQGRANAQRLVDRVLAEAEKRGFRHCDTVRALLKRNEVSARLANLVQDACDLIEKPMHSEIMDEALNARITPMQAEPETNPAASRPGPDGVDPRFWEAGYELQRIAAEEGKDAIHKPQHAHLYAKLFKYAPEPLKSEMRAMAEQMNLVPKATHVTEDGRPVFSAEQLAETHGVSVEEVKLFIDDAGIDPEDIYTGPVHPLQ